MRILILLIAGLIYCGSLGAQKGYEIGGWVGGSHYFGDLNNTFRLNKPGFAAGIIGRYNFNPRLSFRLSANYGRVGADDAESGNTFQQARNLSFRSNVIDGTFQFEFNFLPYIHGSDDSYFTPYLAAGLCIYSFDPQAQLNGEWIRLQPLGTEGQPIGGEYTRVQPALAYTFGAKVDLSYAWSINVEISGRALYSDYLDDVSTIYPNLVELNALRGPDASALSDRSLEVGIEPVGGEGRQRGNSKDNDSYAFLSVGLVYYIGTLQCPPISRHKN